MALEEQPAASPATVCRSRRPPSALLAGLLSLLLPGAGQLHRGAWVRGALLIAATLGLLALFVLRSVEVVLDAAASAPPRLDLAQAWRDAVLSRDWSLYDGQHVVFQPRAMSVRELAEGHERAWKRVYRLSSIARRLWVARNFQPLALTANLGYRYYAHNLHRYYTCDWPIEALPAKPRRAPAAASERRTVCG